MPRDSQSHPTPALLPMIPLVTGTLVERKKQKQTLIFRNEDHSWMKREKGRGSSKSKIFRWVFPSGVQTVPWHHQSTRESTRTEKKAHTNVVGNSVLKRGQRRRFSGRSLLSKKKKKVTLTEDKIKISSTIPLSQPGDIGRNAIQLRVNRKVVSGRKMQKK